MEKIIKEKMVTIQKKFDFKIPNYVLEEIIIGNKDNLKALIGLAKVNDWFSEDEANILIFKYCEKNEENSRVLEMLSANY